MDTNVWLPIATLIGGAALGYIAESLRDRREYEREQDRNRIERRRQSMLELIAEMNQLWMAASRARDNQIERAHEDGEWDLVGDREFTETLEGPILRCQTLAHLVDNDEIRTLATKTIDAFWVSALRTDRKSADSQYQRGRDTHDDLMKRLGEHVRSL